MLLFLFLYFVVYSLYLILVQLTLLCLVVYGSTVSAPCSLVVLFHFKCFYVPLSYFTVNGINKVMMMMMMMMIKLIQSNIRLFKKR